MNQRYTKNPSGRAPDISISRKCAVHAFRQVMEKDCILDIAVNDAAHRACLPARDRAFVLQLVNTALRRYGSLITIMDHMLQKPLGEKVAEVKTIILMGMTQIFFMRTDDHAAVNETVNLMTGSKDRYRGLANAVLRRCIRERDQWVEHMEKSPEEDLPHWLAGSWNVAYGAEAVHAIGKSLRNAPKLDITVKNDADREDLALELGAEILPTGSLRLDMCDVVTLSGYDQGGWWIQDMAAAIPATLLGDIDGKTVVDFCAAPGGKTMQLSAQGANVVAVDRSRGRLKRLHANLHRTWLKAKVIVADALSADLSDYDVDHILLDAPCSATGTLRRNPDLMWCKNPDDVARLADLQSRLLDHTFGLLPEGGIMVYCVCSLESAEGIDQITKFLDRTPDAERVVIKAEEVGNLSELITDKGDMLCLPHYLAEKGGMDGFYTARIQKRIKA